MELLESQDPEKRKLIETSERHKRALEKELNGLTKKTDQMVKNALIIGGSLLVTYIVVSSLSGRKKKRKQKLTDITDTDHEHEEEKAQMPSVLTAIGSKVLDQATFLLLDVAKEKLSEYLKSRKPENENS